MKQMWKEILIAAMLGLLLPSVLLSLAVRATEPKNDPVTSLSASEEQQEIATTQETKSRWTIPVLKDGSWRDMELNTYLTGVVLAEMPVSFEPETHKAQAVVARTYALRQWLLGSKHSGGICTDPTCCQGYLSEEEFLAAGGKQSDLEQVAEAVAGTGDLVLTYEGKLIEATYFSCSGGYTEDAVAVWGTEIPYLQATESLGEENATHYSDTVWFTVEEFSNALGITLSGNPESWVGSVTETAGGGVGEMEIGGVVFSGTTLRQLLGLRSTAFTLEADAEGITVTTRGYGHRVGMSQYGADAMAVNGSTFEEILFYYYQGVELTEYSGQNN